VFCHECPPQEAQRRKRVKRQLMRPVSAAAGAGAPPTARQGMKAGHQRHLSDGSTAASSGARSGFSHSRQSSGASSATPAARDEFEGFAEGYPGAAPYCMAQPCAPQMVGFAGMPGDGMGGQPQLQYMLVPIGQVMSYACMPPHHLRRMADGGAAYGAPHAAQYS